MPECEEFHPPRRNRNLSDADIQALIEAMQTHQCKFSEEEVADFHKFSRFFREIEKKVVGGIAWGIIALIAGFFWLLYNHGWFFKGK